MVGELVIYDRLLWAMRSCLVKRFCLVLAFWPGPTDVVGSEHAALAAVHRMVPVRLAGRDQDQSLLMKIVYDPRKAETMPCVLFLSGLNCPHESYMWLAARLATCGCAVVLSSCAVPLGPATTNLLSTPYDVFALRSLERYRLHPAREGLAAVLSELRWLNEASNDSPLAGRLDLGRLSIGGHSAGGRMALDVAVFDGPFDVRAVFCYGASLVNSGWGAFAPRGSVLACENKRPPPVLLLGGAEDGVSAALSASGKDATEALRRTVAEALKPGGGSAQFAMIRGANHMVFCDPVDPCCGAATADWPLADGAEGGEVRALLGSLIVDFLAAQGLVPDRQAGSEPAIDAQAHRLLMDGGWCH